MFGPKILSSKDLLSSPIAARQFIASVLIAPVLFFGSEKISGYEEKRVFVISSNSLLLGKSSDLRLFNISRLCFLTSSLSSMVQY